MSVPSTNWMTKMYGQFRGVDYSTDATNIADERAADMRNMIADEAGFPTKRVGWRELCSAGNGYPVNGIHYMKYQKGAGVWFLHIGTKLYAVPHIKRMRNVLPDGDNLDREYGADFLPDARHVEWLQDYVNGTATVQYQWQVSNADNNGDGVVDDEDVKLLQALVDGEVTADQEGTVFTEVYDGMQNTRSTSLEHDGNLYLLDGEHYLVIKRKPADTEAGTDYIGQFEIADVEGYIPTTANHGYYFYDEKIDKDPGTWVNVVPYEERNYLSNKVINEMSADGKHKNYWLNTFADSITKVEVYKATAEDANRFDWVEIPAADYTATDDVQRTKITFTTAPAQHPDGAGIDNIRVTFVPKETLDSSVIKKCTIGTRFGYFNDNRFFLAGNPAEPNKDYMSGVDDPTYFPEFGWTKIGSEYSSIQGYLHYGDILAVIKEDTNTEAEIYIRSCEVQSDSSVLYPVQQGVIGVGAASRYAFCNLRDDALFYAKEGVYAVVGTDASQANTLQNRSFFVDTRLRQESGQPVACVWNDRYLLCFPETGHVYVADGKQQTSYGTAAYFYEWYVWDNIRACAFYAIDGDLYFGTQDGRFCKFNNDLEGLNRYSDGMTRQADGTWGNGTAIPCYWKTKADFLAGISETKSLARRGCSLMLKPYDKSSVQAVVESTGLIVNQTVDVVGNDVITTVFPFERSVRHFSTLQITLSNNELDEGFGLYGIQLRYAVSRLVRRQ